MDTYIKPYAKALVCFGLLAVFFVGAHLGVDTGIDPEAVVQALVLALVTTAGVYAVPNKSKTEGDEDRG